MSLVGTPIAEIVPSVPTVRLISATEKAKLIETEGVKEENTESSSKNKPASIDKKERRREQNRRAAVKSRKRKKVYMQELEAKVKELKETNENLLSKMQALLEENERLKKRQRADNVVKVKKESPGTAVLSMEPVVKSESADGVDGSDDMPKLDVPRDDTSSLWKPVDLLESDRLQQKPLWPTDSFEVSDFFVE
eukprot:CAMPEP_0167763820 /NCGR_PEP_ID=MMETSP0110_2-20121227/13629_1 /TAXON_ID=629695 /ORGANISM="Gymnochlora sp., Strain CCMP2014" /LENGTH=193 /DNA_ID=CAMNT_0007651035 /DNA_START=117 /DNA_END=698 /DNA_ORIENTATION=-